MWAVLVAGALALDGGGVAVPREPAALLRVSPEAQVEVLPTTHAGQAEILVRHNRMDLRAQLSELAIAGVRATHASDLGGAWHLVFALEDPATHLVVDHHGAALVATVAPGSAKLALPQAPVASVQALFDGTSEPPTCRTATLPLEALTGPELSYGLDAAAYAPELPRWTKAEPAESDWEQVSTWRERIWVARTAKESAYFTYKLGALFRNLGHAREAAYYFGAAGESGGGGWEIPLQRAGAFLSVRRYERAVAAAESAWRLGAPDEAVLEVLGVSALATGSPPPAEVGRALALATGRAEPLFLAGALLLRESCPSDAQAPLALALGRLPPERDEVARLMLADAFIGAGDLKEASIVLAGAGPADPEIVGLRRVRNRLLTLLRESPDAWAQMVPVLEQAGAGYTPEGAESLHLVAQIQMALGDDRSAIESWSLLLLRHRLEASGRPAARLLDAFVARLERLLAKDRPVDALSLYEAIWRPEFLPQMGEVETLRSVADAYRGVGLPRRALSVVQDMWSIEGREGRDDRATTLALARLYAELGEDTEALETIQFLRSARTLDDAAAGELSLIEGRVRRHQGDPDGARAAFVAASNLAPTADAGRAERAILDAERDQCDLALPDLAAAVKDPRYGSPANLALLSHCHAARGEVGPAALAARNAATDAVDGGFRAWVGWVADRLAGTTTAPESAEAPPASAGMWDRLRAENRAQAEFQARMDERKAR